jgi:hypothetical protein
MQHALDITMQHAKSIDFRALIDSMDKKLAARVNEWRLAQSTAMTPEEAIRELLDRALKAEAEKELVTDDPRLATSDGAEKVDVLVQQLKRAAAQR